MLCTGGSQPPASAALSFDKVCAKPNAANSATTMAADTSSATE
jgi:hypothetical protein